MMIKYLVAINSQINLIAQQRYLGMLLSIVSYLFDNNNCKRNYFYAILVSHGVNVADRNFLNFK